MKLEGIHHVSSITGDAQANVDFYAGVLGLRMVKKTVNQDDPTVYHLFYGDDKGSPGLDLTFFEYPGASRGRAGRGMIHRIVLRVGSVQALDFWERRLGAGERTRGSILFSDPEGLGLELRVVSTSDASLTASHPEIPTEHAIQGFEEVRAYTADPDTSRNLLENALGFERAGAASWQARGEKRSGRYVFDTAPGERGVPGAGTVHHVAWASLDEEQVPWRDRVIAGGASPTPVIDRYWFKSVYFREPSGVLFEIATMGPGFAVDEDPAHLGERLVLPPKFEHLRERLEGTLTPIHAPAVAHS
ncbi:MAG: glyoxalase [Actinobacteria bacterium 13_1_20CM_2_65_11]|nr:MAG: glyoxalase [Actinobacteria bacterium 13_1_40CM_4_65_12]OLE79331.1 MAG: glyoxalase [Actinobacteria bacterium 13_1_20CM_2_65_11]